jgi:phosphoglycolate phosphatase-like HAD superfamily hydrolase
MAARKKTTFPRPRATGRKLSSTFDAQVWVFDVEGTLVDAVMPTLRCWRRTFELFGHDVGLAELHRLSGMDGAEMLEKLLPHVPAIERQEMLQCQGVRFREDFLADVPAFPKVAALFERLRQDGCRIALATDCGKDELRRYLDITGTASLLDAVACGDDVRRGKPAEGVLDVALRRVRRGRKAAVMVGDTPFDAMAARKAGIASIGLLTGHFAAHDLEQAGCDAVFRDPAALIEALRERAGAEAGARPAPAMHPAA